MTNYVKTTNFTSKDALSTGNPLKIIKGTEFDVEFNAIATASATKANIVSPTFTGTPAAPTATLGTNTTQLATTAFVQAALQAVYPVGCIYTSTTSTNPGTTFGFGTWVAFGAGKVMVGFDTGGDTLFDALEETGGSKDAIVVSHTHTASTNTTGAHSHTATYGTSGADNAGGGNGYFTTDSSQYSGVFTSQISLASAGDHAHTITVDSAGSSATNANIQPYITVAMWKRTA